ncbi:MAG TPA: metal ABC transporter permease [Thermohalobaculum sp.]|nr:metal ABC transporter permease [Thermohalobaculum sp.]
MSLLHDFVLRALLAGLGVALIAAPVGCFVLWRRMAYFGDTVAHAALLGVALALATGLPLIPAVLAVALLVAVTVATAGRLYGADALLGVLAHGGLALALVVLALTPGASAGIEGWLFGDLLAVSRTDVLLIWAGAALAGAVLCAGWTRLLNATINEELAVAEGGDPRRERLALTLALAVIVAVALKVVGALLITALLILPAAAARPLARAPEAMAAIAAGLAALSVAGGLRLSWVADTPAGPSIVVSALALVVATNLAARLLRL